MKRSFARLLEEIWQQMVLDTKQKLRRILDVE